MKQGSYKLLVVVAMAVLCAWGAKAQEYTFTTLAGTASRGSSDGIGSTARFHYPDGIATDTAGNLYVADVGNHTIRKITQAGLVTTLAGLAGISGSQDGPIRQATFNSPYAVAADDQGNLYVADNGNNTIRKISVGGIVTTLAGLAGSPGNVDGQGSLARFSDPEGVAVDHSGNVFVVANHALRKITPDGTVTTLAGLSGIRDYANGTGTDARFGYLGGITIDSAGVMYVTDVEFRAVRKITPAGVVTTLVQYASGADLFSHPRGLAVDGSGNVYMAELANQVIHKISADGVVTTLVGLRFDADGSGFPDVGYADGTGSAARFNYPSGVAIDGTGILFVTDSGNNVIRRIGPGATVSTLAGVADLRASADGFGTNAVLAGPQDVALDRDRNAYVSDFPSHTIRKIAPGGEVTTVAGLNGVRGSLDGAGGDARFNSPSGIAIGIDGSAYVADYGNHTIRRIAPDGVVSTIAGMAGLTGSADGIGTAARFTNPTGIATDGAGNIYVADTGNRTIRMITSGGVVRTLAGTPGVAGSQDGVGNKASFSFPIRLAVDSAGNVYVAEAYNHTVRKVTAAGVVTTLTAAFSLPTGVCVDASGNLFVTDSGTFVVRKIAPTGAISTIGGFSGIQGSEDGMGNAARFGGPSGIAVDASGTLYIADSFNHTIRVGQPLGLPVINPLQIVLAGNQVVVSWPTNLAGFGLESSTGFLPGATWTPVTAGIATVADRYTVTNQVGVDAKYYRLKK